MKTGAENIPSGTKVKCDLINGVWYVTSIPSSAGLAFFSGTLPGVLHGSDSSIASVTLTPIDSGSSPTNITGATVHNSHHCAGASGAFFKVYLDQASGYYEFDWVANTASTDQPVTAMQFDGTEWIQIETRKLYGNWDGSESGWTNSIDTTTC